jgi:hypothetical protein
MLRPALTLAAVAATLALGACGGSNDPASSTSPQDKAFEGALKFSQCMREHGINMPDPQRVGSGGIKLAGPKGAFNPNDPKMKAAQQACQKYMEQGGGQTMDPARRARLQEAALKFARCMRSHGIDVPDPKMSANGGLTMRFGGPGAKGGGPTGPNPDSPAFKKAQESCQHFLGDAAPPATNSEKG